MEMERRALYNLMRQNWLLDPTIEAEPWQVEDYRSLPIDSLFERLSKYEINLDKNHFIALSDEVDNPEDLTDLLMSDVEMDAISQDKVYLIIFELWRRFITNRPCLSIFCDELDHQIHLYDSEKAEDITSIQDTLANLQVILDENTDAGADPQQVFESICSGCANDVENFLYDYISDQIEDGNPAYASDLLDGFINYVKDVKWFDFLRARLLAQSDVEGTHEIVCQLAEHYLEDNDLDFNLDLLAFMVQAGDKDLFNKVVKKTMPLIEKEDDFKDLLGICADFFHCLDLESQEQEIQKISRKRSHLHSESTINAKDPQIAELLSILNS